MIIYGLHILNQQIHLFYRQNVHVHIHPDNSGSLYFIVSRTELMDGILHDNVVFSPHTTF